MTKNARPFIMLPVSSGWRQALSAYLLVYWGRQSRSAELLHIFQTDLSTAERISGDVLFVNQPLGSDLACGLIDTDQVDNAATQLGQLFAFFRDLAVLHVDLPDASGIFLQEFGRFDAAAGQPADIGFHQDPFRIGCRQDTVHGGHAVNIGKFRPVIVVGENRSARGGIISDFTADFRDRLPFLDEIDHGADGDRGRIQFQSVFITRIAGVQQVVLLEHGSGAFKFQFFEKGSQFLRLHIPVFVGEFHAIESKFGDFLHGSPEIFGEFIAEVVKLQSEFHIVHLLFKVVVGQDAGCYSMKMHICNHSFCKNVIWRVQRVQRFSVAPVSTSGPLPTLHVALVAPTKMSVLILGESGTGKEYIARMIHEQSGRSSKPFIAVDCGSLSMELAPSELFGHKKGSFTSAIADKKGVFEEANGGTVFLDEVGNLPYEVQKQLLRALQEQKVRPVGSAQDINVDVRIIAATNEDLERAIEEGRFRQDLYHRINEFSIEVPPLRERLEDMEEFAYHFLAQANDELGKDVKHISKEALDKLKEHRWDGNLRELRNVIRRATLFAENQEIVADNLPILSSRMHKSEETEDLALQPGDEKSQIIAVLKKARGNKTVAAKLLQIDRKTLYNKMHLYGIDLT